MNGTWTLAAILGYVAVQIGIGAIVSRSIRTESDYVLAGRRLGYGLATFSIFATWFGAESCIGACGRAYEEGLAGGTTDPFGYAGTLFFMGLVFAAALWRRKLTTLADLFRNCYSKAVEGVVIVLMLPVSLFWAAAQVLAFGHVLAAAVGLSPLVGIGIASGVVITYTMLGGLLADAWNDLLQGIVLITGLIVLFVLVTADHGGPIAALATVPSARLSFAGHGDRSLAEILDAWAVPVCGSVIGQELVSRVLASRSQTVARNSTLIAGGMYLCIGLLPFTLGLLGPGLVPEGTEPEQVLATIAGQRLHGALYVLFLGALVAAILSTVDTVLLVSATMLSHNLLVPRFPQITEMQKVRLARGCVLGLGLLALGGAIGAELGDLGIADLVTWSSSCGSAGIFVVAIFALFTRIGGTPSALAALLGGAGTWLVLTIAAKPCAFLWSVGAAVAGYLALARAGQRQPGAVTTA